jgi:hypothetical protein
MSATRVCEHSDMACYKPECKGGCIRDRAPSADKQAAGVEGLERERFERIVRSLPWHESMLRRDAGGSYVESEAHIAWTFWEARAALAALSAPQGDDASADDLRAQGWAVAVHNDYRLNGEAHTFWLLTNDDRAIKGEGRTSAPLSPKRRRGRRNHERRPRMRSQRHPMHAWLWRRVRP